MTDDINDMHKRLSQCNHLNFGPIVKDIERLGCIIFTWERSTHREKFIKTAKKELASKKGNFGDILMRKICLKKIPKYLSSNDENDEDDKHNPKNYEIKNKEVL